MKRLLGHGVAATFVWSAYGLLLVGCSEGTDLGHVRGRVTLNGEPLAKARLLFLPTAGGRPATARTDSDGRYELRFDGNRMGALIGRHEVKISTFSAPLDELDADGNLIHNPAQPERLPPRYHAQSELTAEIEPGQNSLDFDLKSD